MASYSVEVLHIYCLTKPGHFRQQLQILLNRKNIEWNELILEVGTTSDFSFCQLFVGFKERELSIRKCLYPNLFSSIRNYILNARY